MQIGKNTQTKGNVKNFMELTKLDAIAESETLRVEFEGVVAKAKATAALDIN